MINSLTCRCHCSRVPKLQPQQQPPRTSWAVSSRLWASPSASAAARESNWKAPSSISASLKSWMAKTGTCVKAAMSWCSQRRPSRWSLSSKLNNVVEYPLEGLDLRHFLHKEFIGSPLSSNSEYDLLGIVNHRGSFNGGHYVAYCRNLETGRWLEFDDSRVREISKAELMTVQAYLLFYIQKSEPDRERQRQDIVKSISNCVDSSATAFVSKQWYNRLVNSSNPGPIDSFDVTCRHGQLRPTLFNESNCSTASFLKGIPDAEDFLEQLRAVYGELGGFGILREPGPWIRLQLSRANSGILSIPIGCITGMLLRTEGKAHLVPSPTTASSNQATLLSYEITWHVVPTTGELMKGYGVTFTVFMGAAPQLNELQ